MRMGKMSEYLTDQEQRRRRSKENLRDMTKDGKRQLRRAYERVHETMGVEIPLKG